MTDKSSNTKYKGGPVYVAHFSEGAEDNAHASSATLPGLIKTLLEDTIDSCGTKEDPAVFDVYKLVKTVRIYNTQIIEEVK